ncbi:hypothetical protein [Pedobacter sp. MR22-3]|uniref:hypothetical protein n=1 Tax=Pedobacter sp. MR22-3 TaxID=2994552 RepID=UPI002247BB9E|nr:hypothetical protein [Pedobacter sp. MR22-3]MCX2585714.1 hypothetical protein [Pedobacter sp. MR22-3]
MNRLEIYASSEEINDLITLLGNDSKFENIRKQIIDGRDQSNHRQDDEISAEGDHEYIERSE